MLRRRMRKRRRTLTMTMTTMIMMIADFCEHWPDVPVRGFHSAKKNPFCSRALLEFVDGDGLFNLRSHPPHSPTL